MTVHHDNPAREPEREPTTGEAMREVTIDALGRLETVGPSFWPVVVVLGLVFLVGIVAFSVRLVTVGLGHREAWGYLAATLGFLLITVQAAPLLAAGLHFVKADWRRQVDRSSRLFAVPGVLSLLLYIPLLLTLPPIQGRRSIWFNWPFGAPGLYDTIAIVLLVALGLALLYFSAVPDFAAARDHFPGPRWACYDRLALGWQGTIRQWIVLRWGLLLLGAFYALMLSYVLILIPVDFAMSLVPGWISAVFPAFVMLTALQCAVAVNLIALFLWRRFGGLGRYLAVDHFWGAAKLLLAFSLLWFYFWWSDFLTYWYGRTPRETAILDFLAFGTYFLPFLLAFVLSFVVPFLTLIYNRVRIGILGPTLVSISVLAGNFFNQVRFYVAGFSIEDVAGHRLETLPPPHLPDILDVLMAAGVLAGAVMLYLLATRVIPSPNIWEVKEGLLFRTRRRLLRGNYVVIAKPR